jgi:hypothetical protein
MYQSYNPLSNTGVYGYSIDERVLAAYVFAFPMTIRGASGLHIAFLTIG